MKIMIGTILRQRYKIIEQLGAGGFGETYLAEDLDIPVTPKPKCVVKRLQPHATDPDIVRLFEKEAQILHKLGQDHDRIPKLFAYFQENQEFYLIQELIEGNDLSKELTPGKQFSESYVIKLLQDILEILAFVHQNNVIHRDIKPSNIMLRKRDGKLVLIDFGIVKEIGTMVMNAPRQTSRTVAIGTPGYMPSEQALGRPKLSSDIYAVGMTAIQTLTGLAPDQLSEDNDGEVIWRDRTSVSDSLADILTKMVRYDFRQRYPSATEALRDLIVAAPPIPLLASPSVTLVSAVGIDYTRLRDLLAAEKWREADRETTKAMLKVARREQEGWLDSESIKNFPCEDLRSIDQLWVHFSKRRFGFSVQTHIWLEVGQDYGKFGQRVGWRGEAGLFGGAFAWKSYNKLTFTSDAPVGHLPVMRGNSNWAIEGAEDCDLTVREWISSLASRLIKCNL
ncbi:MAG TPA: serine/threonine-protein kinase [Phormidium sp.]